MNSFTSTIYNSVFDIPPNQWEDLNCTSNVYFSPKFLNAFESSNPKIDFKYLVVSYQNTAVALALIQTIELGVDAILKNIKISQRLKGFIHSLFCNNSIRIMFGGNIFLSGEHGIFIADTVNKTEALNVIAQEIKALAKRTKPLHAVLVKDFLNQSLPLTNHFKNFGFASMHVEPNMILELDPNWKTYEDYKNALKSKYRVKVNKADKTSKTLTARIFSETDFATYKDELQKLYENTIANANFNAQVLDLNTYIKLRATYHEDFIVKAYFIEDTLVGFLTALANNKHLDAHFIGLNYELNKRHAIYPRILNDYVRIGIEKQVSHINLGRTASEIKSTIGALPVDLTVYIRHKRSLINTVIRFLIKSVKIKEFKQHSPYKT